MPTINSSTLFSSESEAEPPISQTYLDAKHIFDTIVASDDDESLFIDGLDLQDTLSSAVLSALFKYCFPNNPEQRPPEGKLTTFAKNCHKIIFNVIKQKNKKLVLDSDNCPKKETLEMNSGDDFHQQTLETVSKFKVSSHIKIKTAEKVTGILPLLKIDNFSYKGDLSLFNDLDKELNMIFKNSLPQRMECASRASGMRRINSIDFIWDYIWGMLEIIKPLISTSQKYMGIMRTIEQAGDYTETTITSIYKELIDIVVEIFKTFVFQNNDTEKLMVDQSCNIINPTINCSNINKLSCADLCLFIHNVSEDTNEISANIEVKKYIVGFETSDDYSSPISRTDKMQDISNLIFPNFAIDKFGLRVNYRQILESKYHQDVPYEEQIKNVQTLNNLFKQIVTYMIRNRTVYAVLSDLYSTNILLKLETDLINEIYPDQLPGNDTWFWYDTSRLPHEFCLENSQITSTRFQASDGLYYEIESKLLNHKDFKEIVDYSLSYDEDSEAINNLLGNICENFLSTRVSDKEKRAYFEMKTLLVLKKNIILYIAEFLRSNYGRFDDVDRGEFLDNIINDRVIRRWSVLINDLCPLPFTITHLPFKDWFSNKPQCNEFSQFDNIFFFQSTIISMIYGLDRTISRDGIHFNESLSLKLQKYILRESRSDYRTDSKSSFIYSNEASDLTSGKLNSLQGGAMDQTEEFPGYCLQSLSISGLSATNFEPSFQLPGTRPIHFFKKRSQNQKYGKISMLRYLSSLEHVKVIKKNISSPISTFLIEKSHIVLPNIFPELQQKISTFPQKVVIKIYYKPHLVNYFKALRRYERLIDHYVDSPRNFQSVKKFSYSLEKELLEVFNSEYDYDSDSDYESGSENEDCRLPLSEELEHFCEKMFESARTEGYCYEKINHFNQWVIENPKCGYSPLRSFKLLDQAEFYDVNKQGYFILTEYVEPDKRDLTYYSEKSRSGSEEDRNAIEVMYEKHLEDMKQQFATLALLHIQHNDVKSDNLLMNDEKLYIHGFSEAQIMDEPSYHPGDIN